MKGRPVHRAGYATGLLLSCCLALAHLLPPASAAEAQAIEDAREAYTQGRFADAARMGEAVGTSKGLALAARSLTIHAYYIAGKHEREALLERAVELARTAVRSDSGNADAHLQLARALGRYAQAIGTFEAANRGYAEKIREATETALRLDPEMVSAHLSLGRWHAGVVGMVGSFLARITFGAREAHALASLERAFELAPDKKAVPLEYALGLLALDEDEYREKARGLLKRAVELPAKDAYENLLHKRAVKRLRALGGG